MVYGGDNRIPKITNTLTHKDKFKIGNLSVECFHTKGHTQEHICYYVQDLSTDTPQRAVFTGDTLFVAGCGRFFEGTAQDMYTSLITILSKLPSDTKVYCGHEYTHNNIKVICQRIIY